MSYSGWRAQARAASQPVGPTSFVQADPCKFFFSSRQGVRACSCKSSEEPYIFLYLSFPFLHLFVCLSACLSAPLSLSLDSISGLGVLIFQFFPLFPPSTFFLCELPFDVPLKPILSSLLPSDSLLTSIRFFFLSFFVRTDWLCSSSNPLGRVNVCLYLPCLASNWSASRKHIEWQTDTETD